MRKQSGFTIMELMTVLGILAILSSIAVPNILGWLPNHRLGGAARDVLSMIELTRVAAVRANANATITFQLGGDSCTALIDGAPLQNETLPADVRFSGNTFAGQTLEFDGQGRPSEDGTVALTNDQGTVRSIVVSLGGNASIQ